MLPAAAPEEKTVDELMAMIPKEQREFERSIMAKHNVPAPKQAPDLYTWGGLDQKRALDQLEVVFDERVPVFASGLGSPAFILDRAHQLDMQVWGLVGKPRQAKKQIAAGTDVIIAQGYDAAGHTGYTMRTTRSPWHDEWNSPEAPPVLKPPLQMMLSSDYIQGSLDYQRKDLMTEAAGQGIHYVTEMKPARQILSDLVEEALDVFDRFADDEQ